jgi:hypothetical protein
MIGLVTAAGGLVAAATLSLVADGLAPGFVAGAAYMVGAALVINSRKQVPA